MSVRTLVVCLGLTLAIAGPAGATPSEVAAEVSSEIMSPYCEGVTLHDCASGAAAQMRERIESWARKGWSKDRILDRIEAEWGEAIRAAPKAEGLGLLAWLLPLAALAAGAVIVILVGRAWRARRGPAGDGDSELSADDRRRLEREMAQMREQT